MPTTNKPAPVATGTDPGLYNPVTGPVGPLDTAPEPVPAGPGLGTTATVPNTVPVVTAQTETVNVAASTGSSFVPNTISTNTVVKYLSISDESVAVNSQVTNINFVGTGVSVANNANAINSVVVTIGGGTSYGNSNVVTLLAGFGSNVLSTTGNVTGGNLITGAQVVASGVIQSGTGLSTGGYLSVNGSADLHNTTVTGNLSATGNVTGGYILGNGSQLTGLAATYSNSNVQAYLPTYSGNIGALTVTGNLTVTGTTSTVNTEVVNVNESVVGNIDAGNVRTAGQVSAAGNITGNFFIGNGSTLSSVTAANVVGTVANATYATSAGSATTATTAGTANAVAGANVSGTVANATYATSAGSATTANTVTDAAQANITSVGTLTSLAVTGNTTSGNLLTGGLVSVTGNITAGNVSTVGKVIAGNLDAINLVVNNISSDDSTLVSVQDGLQVYGNIVADNLGNIAAINLTGSSSNVLYGNGTFAPAAGGAANTGNVTFNDVNVIGTGNLNLQPNSASSEYLNIYLTGAADIHVAYGGGSGNVILGTDEEANVAVLLNGNVAIQAGNVGGTKTWNFDTAGNLTLPLNSVVYETNIPDGALSGSAIALKPTGGTTANQQLLIYPTANDGDHIHMTSGNLYTTELFLGSDNFYVKLANTGNIIINSNDGNSSNAMWTFDTDGNLTLPSNTFAVNYANGTQVSIGGGGNANTGNVTFSDQIVIGTGSNDGTGGLYLAPGNASIANSAVQYLRVRGGDVVTHIHLDTGNNAYFDQYFGDDGKYVKLASTGNVEIGSNDAVGNSASWTFDTGGNLTTPSNLVIGPGPGNGSSIFQYNEGLQILGEGANSVVQLGWTANTSAPGSVTTIAMNYPSGGEGNVLIAVGNNATTVNYWLFDNTGNLRLPGNTFAVNYANGTAVSLGGSYGNAEVVANLAALGTNPVSTTGNITSGNFVSGGVANITGNITSGNILTGGIVSATGNITTANSFVGNLVGTTVSITGNVTAGNVVATSVIVDGQPTTYGVANLTTGVVAIQATATGTVTATVVANTSPNLSSFSNGTSTSPATTVFTLSIPSAGTWQLESWIRTFSTTGTPLISGGFYTGGTLVANSETLLWPSPVTNANGAGYMSATVTTTGAATYTVGLWSTATGIGLYSDSTGRTKAQATQISSIFALNTLDTISTTGNVSVGGILSSPQQTKASNETGTVGQICWDANYIYVCTATNTWKRTALTGGY